MTSRKTRTPRPSDALERAVKDYLVQERELLSGNLGRRWLHLCNCLMELWETNPQYESAAKEAQRQIESLIGLGPGASLEDWLIKHGVRDGIADDVQMNRYRRRWAAHLIKTWRAVGD